MDAQAALGRVLGVLNVDIAYPMPLSSSGSGITYYADGTPLPAAGQAQTAESISVSETYFKTMNIAMVAGRYFNEFDTADSQRVAIVTPNV